MIKIGVIGAGHLGKLLLKQLNELVDIFQLIGYFDENENLKNSDQDLFNYTSFENPSFLINACDALIVSVPTPFHFRYAQQIIRLGKHVFIEKPVTETLKEAQVLADLAGQVPQIVVQIGHVERFNPAWLSIQHLDLNPMFIEVHRLAPFQQRGTDVSVILDLMIHDLDLILQLIPYPITEIRANGVAILSPTPDIANARLEFENGAVVNLTASRISLKKMRKMRIFQPKAYISLDFLEKKSQIISLSPSESDISISKPPFHNALKEELRSFGEAIIEKKNPIVSVKDGVNALSLAFRIIQKLTLHS